MVKTQRKNSKKVSLLLIVCFALVISSLNLIPLTANKHPHKENDSLFVDKTQIPYHSYSTNISGQSSTDFDVILHQSYYASDNPLYEITDFNNELNRTFQADCPKDTNFNSSNTRIEIQDIYAPNKTVIYEDDWDTSISLYNNKKAASFTVINSSYLLNITLDVYNDDDVAPDVDGTLALELHKAKWDNTNSRHSPDGSLGTLKTGVNVPDAYNGEIEITGLSNNYLDTSKTINKTFFIVVIDSTDNTAWKYDIDTTAPDTSDELDCFNEGALPDQWIFFEDTGRSIDFTLTCDFYPATNTPSPEVINMEINGSGVDNNVGNSGIWNSNDGQFTSSKGELNFTVAADWWDVQLNITKITVNYTKELTGTANYFIEANDASVQWNVTLSSAVDDFESGFSNKYINHTIPEIWDESTIKVYNGTNIWSGVSSRSIGGGWREVNTPSAGNGTWILSCNSTNLLSSIDMFIEGTLTLITNASLSSRVVFNATFSSRIATNDGKINLTVYNPDSLSNTLNYSEPIPSFSSGKNITLTTWDVDSTVGDIINPLDFRVQCWWYNDTAAGFLETNITIIEEQNTNIELPITHRTVPRGFIANYTFNYTMETDGSPITNAYIVENYLYPDLSRSYTANDGGDGNYTIHIDTDNIENADLGTVFDCNFTIQAIARKAIKINLTITITMPRTEMLSITDNLVEGVISEGLNITLNFTFNDAEKDIPITAITTSNISVENIEEPGTQWDRDDPDFPNEGYLLYNHTNGKYSLNISTLGLTRSNSYTLRITINYTSSNPGEYKPYVYNLTFYYASKPDGGGVSPGGGDDDDGGDGDTTIAGIPYELFILIIILVVAGALGTAIAVVIYKKTIVPRKEAKERERAEVMSIFDDALNIEHILVLHPQSGGCIFTRTFRIEEIDPQLIGGFLSAVSSFSKEFGTEEDPLGEIKYQNRNILLGDGNFVRVALLLEKKASKYLKQHLTLFIDAFEQEYKAHLEGWQGRIDVFSDAQELIDQYLNMSIIRPHYIQHEAEKIKKLTSPLSRDLLKVAVKLAQQSKEEKNQEIFWISTLLKEGERQLKKYTEDIWVRIKELRDLRILMPIEFVDLTPESSC